MAQFIDDFEEDKILLITGNGFDLYCGVESSFKDYLLNTLKKEDTGFFEPWLTRARLGIESEQVKFHHVDNVIKKNINFFKKYELEIILILIEAKEDMLWSDFERAINTLVTKSTRTGVEPSSPWETAYVYYKSQKMNYGDDSPISFIGNFCSIIDYKTSSVVRDNGEWNAKLTKLINNFENAFGNYLSEKFNEVKIKGDYYERIRFLLRNLMNKDNDENDNVSPLFDLNILTFNYTTPDLKEGHIDFKRVEHVHGTINESKREQNIIIGIDSSSLKVDVFGYELTKTYRKAKAFVYNESKKPFNLLDTENTKVIKFFGHSLNKQDFSYFQSIFDTFDLYNSDIRLEFYFTIFKKGDEIKIRNDEIKRIVTLMEDYGSKLPNEDQGKNLLHKLLLQSRLFISEIPYKPDSTEDKQN